MRKTITDMTNEENRMNTLESVLRNHPGAKRDALIPILQEVQEAQGYISRDAVAVISRHLRLPASKIYGVATFYNQFRFEPVGKHHIQVCRGTACHVKGSAKILDAVRQELKIEPGRTSRDGLFSLEVVACIGACGLAPVISINGEFFAGLTPDRAKAIVRDVRRKEMADHAPAR
jgi:NADH-quinone oxidoreductase E subunit